jgi:transcriptional regulator with XRE-family HTH domain
MNIGERITNLRQKKGWSQAELARQATIGQSTLHAYESGTRAATGMSVDVAIRLARVLGVTVDYLVGVYEEHERQSAPVEPPPAPPRARRREPTGGRPKRQRSRATAPVA